MQVFKVIDHWIRHHFCLIVLKFPGPRTEWTICNPEILEWTNTRTENQLNLLQFHPLSIWCQIGFHNGTPRQWKYTEYSSCVTLYCHWWSQISPSLWISCEDLDLWMVLWKRKEIFWSLKALNAFKIQTSKYDLQR